MQPDFKGLYGTAIDVLISDNGVHFKKITTADTFHCPELVQFDKVSARYYRLLFTASSGVDRVFVAGLELHDRYRIPNVERKSLFWYDAIIPSAVKPEVAAGGGHRRDRIVELTAQMDKERPARVGRAAGVVDRAATGPHDHRQHEFARPASGRGWECDKLSKEGIEAQFAGMMKKLVDDCDVKPGEKTGLVATHIDSWENGSQNSTARCGKSSRSGAATIRSGFCPP